MTRLLGALHDDADQADAVRDPQSALSRHELLGRASALAAEITGRRMVAVRATPTVDTVVVITAALLAGVPVVPVPPDAGELERAHILGAMRTQGDADGRCQHRGRVVDAIAHEQRWTARCRLPHDLHLLFGALRRVGLVNAHSFGKVANLFFAIA
jgi:hypothetical protein